MPIVYWPIPAELANEAEDNYRTAFAMQLADREPLEIIRELTFDGVAPRITIADIDGLFSYVEANFLRRPLSGVGVEVGAGPLVFGSIMAKRPMVKHVYGVDICKPIIERLYPKISSFILGDETSKTTAAVGSFDDIKLPTGSVDFVLDFFSLHHSMDINVTLPELRRILKPGGLLLMFDKARSDDFSEADLDVLMDAAYDDVYKKQFGIPLDTRLTRRMNGEREYRVKDWKAAFARAGFGDSSHFNLERTMGGSRFVRAAKIALSFLPVQEQAIINGLLPQKYPNHRFYLSRENRIYTSATNNFRKEMSLLIAYAT